MKNLYLLKKWLYKNKFKKEALAISSINRLYKKAISEAEISRLRKWYDEDKSKLSFDDLFEGKLRITIPFSPEDAIKLKDIITFLKDQKWKPAGNNSRFDTAWVTQKLQTPEGDIIEREVQVADLKVSKTEKIKIPTGPRAGEIVEKKTVVSISKLLANPKFKAPEWMAEWWQNKQTEYTRDSNWKEIEYIFSHDDSPADYSIIITRHPIDVLRMSDYENIKSCHTEGESHFDCAIEESRGHGPVAMLVKTSDLEDLLQPPSPTGDASDGIDISDLDGQEIFKDQVRGVRGITPKARVRLRRFVNEEEDYEFAVPENKKYGPTPPGFIDVVRKWAWNSQKHLFEDEDGIELPDEGVLKLYGGSYRDNEDGDLLNLFFNKGGIETEYYGNLERRSEDGEDLATLWANELGDIMENYNSVLKHVSINADINDENWGNPIVTAGADLRAEINLDGWEDVAARWEYGAWVHPGDLKDLPINLRARWRDRDFERCLEHDEGGEIYDLEVRDNKLIIDISFTCDDCSEPNDVSNHFEWIERYVDSEYDHYVEKVRRKLVKGGYIKEKAFDFFAEKIESFNLSNLNVFGDKYDYDGEILISPKPESFEFGLDKVDLATADKLGLPIRDFTAIRMVDFEQQKNEILSLLNNIERQKFEDLKKQLYFSFYQPDDLVEYSSMVSNLKISAKTNIHSSDYEYGLVSPKLSIYVYASESDKKLNLAEKFIKKIDENFEAIKAIIKNSLDSKIKEANDKIKFEAERFYRGETAKPIIEKLKGYNDDVRRLALWIEANWNNFTEEEKEVAYKQYLIPTERDGDYIHDERFDFPKWWAAWTPVRSDWSGISIKDIKINDIAEEAKEVEEEKITELPDNLSVGGNLDLRETNIIELPEELSEIVEYSEEQ